MLISCLCFLSSSFTPVLPVRGQCLACGRERGDGWKSPPTQSSSLWCLTQVLMAIVPGVGKPLEPCAIAVVIPFSSNTIKTPRKERAGQGLRGPRLPRAAIECSGLDFRMGALCSGQLICWAAGMPCCQEQISHLGKREPRVRFSNRFPGFQHWRPALSRRSFCCSGSNNSEGTSRA